MYTKTEILYRRKARKIHKYKNPINLTSCFCVFHISFPISQPQTKGLEYEYEKSFESFFQLFSPLRQYIFRGIFPEYKKLFSIVYKTLIKQKITDERQKCFSHVTRTSLSVITHDKLSLIFT